MTTNDGKTGGCDAGDGGARLAERRKMQVEKFDVDRA
jgi:hypothetical protein